jgi:hypothetical protein
MPVKALVKFVKSVTIILATPRYRVSALPPLRDPPGAAGRTRGLGDPSLFLGSPGVPRHLEIVIARGASRAGHEGASDVVHSLLPSPNLVHRSHGIVEAHPQAALHHPFETTT